MIIKKNNRYIKKNKVARAIYLYWFKEMQYALLLLFNFSESISLFILY